MPDDSKRHPRYPRDPKNPNLAPTIADQFRSLKHWHEFLATPDVEEYPALASLVHVWENIEECQRYEGKPIIQRGSQLEEVARTPLSALFYVIDSGFYPPPELLIVLQDCWRAYESASGQLSLEEAFLGKLRKRAGNYARRRRSTIRLIHMRMELDRLVRAGQTPIEAAEVLSAELGGKPDADSILRMARKVRPRQNRAD